MVSAVRMYARTCLRFKSWVREITQRARFGVINNKNNVPAFNRRSASLSFLSPPLFSPPLSFLLPLFPLFRNPQKPPPAPKKSRAGHLIGAGGFFSAFFSVTRVKGEGRALGLARARGAREAAIAAAAALV